MVVYRTWVWAWVGYVSKGGGGGKEATYGVELFCDSPDEKETAGDLDDGSGEGTSDPAEQDMQDF